MFNFIQQVLKETCAVFRHLILDDDIRVEFSKAHEHARTIAAEVLTELTELLPANGENKSILSELILTIATLTVRHELCLTVVEAGGLKFILNAMVSIESNHTIVHLIRMTGDCVCFQKEHCDSIRLTREALKLLRALAGNDTVKANIIKEGAADLINCVLNLHKVFIKLIKCISIVFFTRIRSSTGKRGVRQGCPHVYLHADIEVEGEQSSVLWCWCPWDHHRHAKIASQQQDCPGKTFRPIHRRIGKYSISIFVLCSVTEHGLFGTWYPVHVTNVRRSCPKALNKYWKMQWPNIPRSSKTSNRLFEIWDAMWNWRRNGPALRTKSTFRINSKHYSLHHVPTVDRETSI